MLWFIILVIIISYCVLLYNSVLDFSSYNCIYLAHLQPNISSPSVINPSAIVLHLPLLSFWYCQRLNMFCLIICFASLYGPKELSHMYLSFSFWLSSLSIIHSSSMYAVLNGKKKSFLSLLFSIRL